MKISLIQNGNESPAPVISLDGGSWYRASDLLPESAGEDVIKILALEKADPGTLAKAISSQENLPQVDIPGIQKILPFQPKSYRDFMLYEEHCIEASRGFVKRATTVQYSFVGTTPGIYAWSPPEVEGSDRS